MTYVHLFAVRYDGSKPAGGHGYQVHIGPMYSDARGSVHITTKDPFAKPALRFTWKGLKVLKLVQLLPASAKPSIKIVAEGFRVIGYLNSIVYRPTIGSPTAFPFASRVFTNELSGYPLSPIISLATKFWKPLIPL